MEKKIISKNFMKRKDAGASLVEYALLVALVSVVGMVAIQALGNNVTPSFFKVSTTLASGDICLDGSCF
jgi:Flp pilus assembly pilin Flp